MVRIKDVARSWLAPLLACTGCVACSAGAEQDAQAPPGMAAGGTSAGKPSSGGSVVTSGGNPPLMLSGVSDPAPTGTGGVIDPDCTPKAIGVVRDFRADDNGQHGHPDFQSLKLFTMQDFDRMLGYPEPGIVLPELGLDKKPVFSGKTFKTVQSKTSFDQWYRDVEGTNIAIQHELPLTRDPVKGTLVFDTNAFFPIDGAGFGNYGPGSDHVVHNFHFTFELHMTFAYAGGEIFEFRGDDDVFVFINGRLVIDLGGVHAPMAGDVQLDARAQELGLEPGNEYAIDVFQAERFTDQSNFRLETSLSFTNCTPIFAEPH